MPAAHGATLTASAEVANARTVTIQLLNGRGKPLVGKAVARAYISTDFDGVIPVGFAADDMVPTAPGAGEVLTDDDKSLELLSNLTGQIALTITNASDQGKVRYLHLVLGNGAVLPPVELQFVDNP